MPFGEYRNYNVVQLSDTAELRTNVFDQDNVPIPADDILLVKFTIQRPDESRDELAGEVEDDGSGFARYTNTDVVGEYVSVAQFTLDSGEKRSVRQRFEVIDPFVDTPLTENEIIAEGVWLRLEDCFDSSEGGPWLRDVTLSYFNKDKIPEFIADALFEINMQPPMTGSTILDFTTPATDTDMPVLVQGTLLAVIRHLMRSYVEQPTPQGAQVVYEDRKDYLQRWQIIYQIEKDRYDRWLALWKRQFLNLGHSALLVSSKAGRLIPAPMRTRTVGRGYY